MIALRNLNVFRIVESEEQAEALEMQDYERVDGYGQKAEEAAEETPAPKKTAAKKE